MATENLPNEEALQAISALDIVDVAELLVERFKLPDSMRMMLRESDSFSIEFDKRAGVARLRYRGRTFSGSTVIGK